MKNLKNFAFGLLVAVLAVGFSAFTSDNSTKSNILAENDLYIWNGSQFVLITSGVFDENDCNTGGNLHCGYRVTEAGKDFVSGPTLTEQDGRDYINESTPYMVPDPESNIGEYDN